MPETEPRPDANQKSVFGMTKPPMHLLPSSALVNVSMVMKLGAQKYGAYNWRQSNVAATVYASAAERHLRSWLDGEDLDPESGQSHLAHMVACGLIVLDAINIDALIDDRPAPAPTGALIAALTVKAVA